MELPPTLPNMRTKASCGEQTSLIHGLLTLQSVLAQLLQFLWITRLLTQVCGQSWLNFFFSLTEKLILAGCKEKTIIPKYIGMK